MRKINKLNQQCHIYSSPEANYIFQAVGTSTFNPIENSTVNWEQDPHFVHGKKIVPYGANNNLPTDLRKILEENNLAPGILKREEGILWGKGPILYKEKIIDNKLKREYVVNSEIQSFLDDINYIDLIKASMTEYKHINGYFVKYFRNRGMRIGGNGFISGVEFEPSKNCRLQWVDSKKLKDVKEIYVGDFEFDCLNTGIKTYPVFDKNDPFRNAVSMAYYNSYTFARDLYSIPDFWGSRHWIMRSSDIPIMLKSLTDNSMAPTYMIKVPSEYWDAKATALQEKCAYEKKEYNPSMLEKLKEETFEMVAKVMSGKTNAGKFITTVSFPDSSNARASWEVEPIEYKAKEFIEAQIKIGEMADAAIMSGISVHPTLANTAQNGKTLSSGSENLYAYKIYLASDVEIPQRIIMQSINTIIRINFPKAEEKLCFYHDSNDTAKEEDTTPANRIVNQKN